MNFETLTLGGARRFVPHADLEKTLAGMSRTPPVLRLPHERADRGAGIERSDPMKLALMMNEPRVDFTGAHPLRELTHPGSV
jgi:hypothetical protein